MCAASQRFPLEFPLPVLVEFAVIVEFRQFTLPLIERTTIQRTHIMGCLLQTPRARRPARRAVVGRASERAARLSFRHRTQVVFPLPGEHRHDAPRRQVPGSRTMVETIRSSGPAFALGRALLIALLLGLSPCAACRRGPVRRIGRDPRRELHAELRQHECAGVDRIRCGRVL